MHRKVDWFKLGCGRGLIFGDDICVEYPLLEIPMENSEVTTMVSRGLPATIGLCLSQIDEEEQTALPQQREAPVLQDSLQNETPMPHTRGALSLPTLDEVCDIYVQRVLAMCAGNSVRASKILGIGRTSLWRYKRRLEAINRQAH